MLQFIFWFLFLCWLTASAVLILVVLVQSGKGGGLSGLVGAGSALGDHLGPTGAEKTLNRWTTYCAIAFVTLTVVLVFFAPKAFRDSPFYRARAIQTGPVAAPSDEQIPMPASPEAGPGGLNAETPAAPGAASSDLGVTVTRDEPPTAEGASPAGLPPASPALPADATPAAGPASP